MIDQDKFNASKEKALMLVKACEEEAKKADHDSKLKQLTKIILFHLPCWLGIHVWESRTHTTVQCKRCYKIAP